MREVIDACRRVTGRPIPERIGPRRPGDPPELVADSSRARKVLAWQPKYHDIESIVATAWRWHSTPSHGFGDYAPRTRFASRLIAALPALPAPMRVAAPASVEKPA